MPPAPVTIFNQDISAGVSFVAIEATGGATTYELELSFSQALVVIDSITPASGRPGDEVTIAGSGSARSSENMVLFSVIAGRVVSSSPNEMRVIVPANAGNGTIKVAVGSRSATGPDYITGNRGPLPPIDSGPLPNPEMLPAPTLPPGH